MLKRYPVGKRARLLTSALSLAALSHMRGQSVQPEVKPAAANEASSEAGDEITLSPFVVEASDDKGYSSKSTLAGTRVRTDLKDIASSISVVNSQFLADTGAKNSQDLLVYTPSTEVAGLRGNFSGAAGSAIYQENTVSTSTRVRGLDSADNTRDYFLTDIPWDGFNVGRVDLQRGPNSILFGIGSPAGIINNSTNSASFKNAYSFEDRVDQFGSVRNQFEINQNIIKGLLAIRVAAVNDERKYEQKPAFNNSRRVYGALKFEPKLFGEGAHTSIRANYEKGRVRSNNPRTLPPVDEITSWFKTGVDAYGNPGYNKLIINQFSLVNQNPSGTPRPGLSGQTLAQNTYELGGWAQTRSYWPDVINYYDGNGTSTKTITAQPNTGYAIPDGGGNRLQGIGGTFRPMGIPSMSQYAAYVGFSNGAYPGSPIPGGQYYADTVITDPTIFNFYKNLLDGPNKKEWQNWNAFNISLEQSFLHDRLAFQVAVDHQDYDQGSNQWMTGSNYAITVDVNATYADGTPNLNAGRPYAGNAASNPNYRSRIQRDTIRATMTAEVRAEDLLGKTTLAKNLGKHDFTVLWEDNSATTNTASWAEFATTPDYITSNSTNPNAANTLNSNRSYEWISYLGPSLKNASSAAGANLSAINYVVEPPKNQQVWNFNSRWNKPTAPNAVGYVDPAAPYVYTDLRGISNTSTQAQNPANYVGWSNQQISWMRDTDPVDYPNLVTAANRNRYKNVSQAVTWQGHLLGGDLVPTFGWRKDKVTSYQSKATTDQNTGFTSLSFPDDLSSRNEITGESKSWGVVYHIPKKLTSRLPYDTSLSLFYNQGKNFKADAGRLSLAGLPIANATGNTKEYGVTIGSLNDRLTLKIAHFETKVENATLADTNGNSIAGLGNNGYFLADGVIWGYAWATSLQDGLRGQTPGTNYWDYSQVDFNYAGDPTSPEYIANNQKNVEIVNAWLNIPLAPTFFSSYNLSPRLNPSIGSKSGNLRDSYPDGYDDVNGPVPGGGSNFGNHQTTVDNISRGTEIELNAEITKNWNLTLNYSKVFATHQNVDTATQDFIGKMTKFMNGPGGKVREWYNGGGTLGAQWNSSIVAPYTVLLNQLGHAAPEVSPWRLNAVTTYNFDHGALKDWFVGGALRMEAGRIIGYAFDPAYKNVNSDDPNYADVASLTLGGLNPDKEFRGKTESHVDLWFGYTRKLSHGIKWRIQANVRSVFEKNKLVASRVNPDGSLALARISQGMGWELTNNFEF